MRLWIECSQQNLSGPGGDLAGGCTRTLTTEDRFLAFVCDPVLAKVAPWNEGERLLEELVSDQKDAEPIDIVAQAILEALPEGVHLPVALLLVREGGQAALFECDAPPLFMAREGRLVLLPVVEEERGGRLIRYCEFELYDGDHMAIVSEGFLQGISWDRRSGWRDIAVATRRLTETRCNAQQLANALLRQYQRLAVREVGGSMPEARSGHPARRGLENEQTGVLALAMFVRPMRSVTVWTGPPVERADERRMLDALLAEENVRVVCGDTTAEIIARMLGAELDIEPPPAQGWAEVPPVSHMVANDGSEPVTMVTEGVVTMRVARERIAEAARGDGARAERIRDLASRADGASRLATVLLAADKVRFIAGMAVNPAQVSADGSPLRRKVVEELSADLRALGKVVSVDYFDKAC